MKCELMFQLGSGELEQELANDLKAAFDYEGSYYDHHADVAKRFAAGEWVEDSDLYMLRKELEWASTVSQPEEFAQRQGDVGERLTEFVHRATDGQEDITEWECRAQGDSDEV